MNFRDDYMLFLGHHTILHSKFPEAASTRPGYVFMIAEMHETLNSSMGLYLSELYRFRTQGVGNERQD